MNHSFVELARYRIEKVKNDLTAADKLLDKNLLLQSIKFYCWKFYTQIT